MKSITDEHLRWRIMIGLSTDIDGAPISAQWARETAIDVANHFDAFSVTDGIGFWNGHKEASLVIERIGPESDRDAVHTVAETIARYLNQAEVWVSEEPVVLTRIVR